MPTSNSLFATWLEQRRALCQERDALRERAHGILVPITRQWCADRVGSDPITGKPVFTLSMDETNVERPAPQMMLRQLSIASFNDFTLTISIPDEAAAIVIETVSSKGLASRQRYESVEPNAPNSYTPDPVLNRKTGATTTAHDRFADILAAFEKAALPQ